jgi:hypothetical protein
MPHALPDQSPDHIVELRGRLRDFLRATMSDEAPIAILSALHYELVSIAAGMATQDAEARGFLRALQPLAEELLDDHGVGRPFP